MIIKDYYKILEFNSNKVNIQQIKTSYRELAKKYHPDKNIGNIRAEERFKDISEAYRILTDPSGRKKYDRIWNSYIGNKRAYRPLGKEETEEIDNTFFTILFGKNTETEATTNIKRKKNAIKGENIETEISISIEDAFNGVEKMVVLKSINGAERIVPVKVRRGVQNNERIKITGFGKEGQNGGNYGDLFIKINVEDNKIFKLEGANIITTAEITPWEAVLGAKINVNGIEELSTIHIPAGTQSKERIVIKQKGYINEIGGRGDLIIEIKIVVPKKLTNKETELFKELQSVSKFNPRTSRS
ncbi:MAG: DnaJ domain-containing protein [Oscillospiraceae bacterium]|nr:DnaJ domain-containing protein [Oscillospiraceae bacterium]